MRALRLLLAAQLGFFALWGGYLLTSHDGAATVWLETEPVDPRDLLSGHFVALRYVIAATDVGDCAAPAGAAPGAPVWVRVAAGGRSVQTPEGSVPLAEAVACSAMPPAAAPGEIWIAGERTGDRGPGLGIAFGIERFYVPETSPLRSARSGQVVAKVAVNDDSQARIVDLVPIRPVAP
jgi:hypothetical protein